MSEFKLQDGYKAIESHNWRTGSAFLVVRESDGEKIGWAATLEAAGAMARNDWAAILRAPYASTYGD